MILIHGILQHVNIVKLLGSLAKNLMILNIGEFAGFAAIVIPSLTGLSKELNPDEMVQITAAQASWLCMCLHRYHYKIAKFFLGF